MTQKRADSSRTIVVGVYAFADLVGKSRPTVQAWIREGLPVRRRQRAGAAHQIEVGLGVRWLLERMETETEDRVAAVHANPALEASRARKLAAEARIAEANAAECEGALVPADQVADRWGRMALAMREGVLAIPAVAVQRGFVAADQEPALADLVHDVLQELAVRGQA